MDLSIIIPTYNQLDYTIKCIESVLKHTSNTFEIIVVDNASTDGTLLYLETVPDIKIVKNNENLGYAKANNQGLKEAVGNIIIFMNNDVVVTEGWDQIIFDAFIKDQNLGAVGPLTNNISGQQKINVNYNEQNLNQFDEFVTNHKFNNKGNVMKVHRLVGFLLACRRDVLETIGGFDEIFGKGNYEDDDLCLRIIESGFDLAITKECFVHHFGSSTFKLDMEEYYSLLKNNKDKIRDKWGFDVHYFMHPRKEIVSLMNIDSTLDNDMKPRVLDLGCGMGATSLEIKNIMDCEIIGVELHPVAARFANRYLDKVLVEDVEKIDFNTLGKFDYVICGDILEHLVDPWDVLKRISSNMNKGGSLIISIPNASNIEVILNLLQGQFPYAEAGILDKTHLRFFSRNDIQTLIPNDLEIVNITPLTIPVNEEYFQFIKYLERLLQKTNIVNDNLEVDLTTYQYLIKTTKKE